MSDIDYSKLDPGIRKTVRWLRSEDFDTCDSGDGVSKPADHRNLDVPHVFMQVAPELLVAEADRLASFLASLGIHVQEQGPEEDGAPCIAASYDPASKVAILVLVGVDDEMLAAKPEQRAGGR